MFSRRIPATSKNLSFNNGFPSVVSNTLCTSYPHIPKSLQNNESFQNNDNKLESELSTTLTELYVNINH
ncbi:putative ORfan [Saudi moumouvirus]|uniref:Uncharacterized protein n=1 Tax=Moumouvirus sp. 'Monve' TaxID=1128131 RepID=H2EEI6_9VIRU|nr:hypothetical protein mv_R604 [Moumouvirus Monve]AQN68300.1 putative ORfan [Saudi moumouvirus]